MAVGGAQKLLFEHAHWLRRNGHRVAAIFFYDRDGLREQWEAEHGFPIYKLSDFYKQAGAPRQLRDLFAGLLNLWKLLRAERFDAMIAFTHDGNLLGIPLAWLAGVPARIGTNLGEIPGMSFQRKRLHAALVNLGVIQTLVASSSRARQNSIQQGVKPERVRVIYNSISPFEINRAARDAARARLGLSENDIFALAVGRLVREKGHDLLIEAMAEVSRARSDVTAGICGGGPLQETLASLIAKRGLDGKARLLGQWDDVRELLEAADIFVLPSRWEGLPMALLEAMMAELPVVAAKVEGVEEVVQDGVQGFVVPLEDSPALAKAILRLAADPPLRRQMGEAAKRRVLESYTAERMCGQYLNAIFERLDRRN